MNKLSLVGSIVEYNIFLSAEYIIDNCDSKINNAIWLLEMKKFSVPNTHSWTVVIDEMVDLLISDEELTSKYLQEFIKKIRELFYVLFIMYKTILKSVTLLLLLNRVEASFLQNLLSWTDEDDGLIELDVQHHTPY